MLGVMNLIALSTGLVLEPRRMWRAYNRGCLSHNLYRAGSRADIDAGKWSDLDRLRGDILETKSALPAAPIRAIMFSMYSALALIIHGSLAVPAVIARFLTDTIGGASLFEAVKPKKRTDLY
jgi:hypothetical protein